MFHLPGNPVHLERCWRKHRQDDFSQPRQPRQYQVIDKIEVSAFKKVKCMENALI